METLSSERFIGFFFYVRLLFLMTTSLPMIDCTLFFSFYIPYESFSISNHRFFAFLCDIHNIPELTL